MKNLWELRNLKVPAALLLILGICMAGIAQDAGPPAEEEKVLTAVDQKMLKRISVDFRETPIDDVIRTIAKQVDLDIVKGPAVTGNVTATLTNVPLEEALNHILTAYGAGFVKSENMIRIVPSDQLTEETEKVVSKIYRIVYADVTEVEQALTKVVSSRGSISASAATGNIMVTDTESRMAAIDSFVEEMDRKTPLILVEAKIYDLKNTDALDLGVEWGAGRNTGRGVGRATGTGMSATGGPVTGFSRSDPFLTGAFDSTTTKVASTGTLDFGILTDHMDVDVLLSAIQQQDTAKLLASPRILVLDNQTASFKAIEEIPYQQLQQGGFQSFGTTEFKEVGVELEVTPHLAKDGLIRLHILPVFSVHVRDVEITTIGTGGTPISSPQPVIDKRQADTIALIQDGETVVIGGLRKQTINQLISKIPLLGDIPVLGALFTFEGEETINSELVVFLTPRIVDEPILTETEKDYLEKTVFPAPHDPSARIDSDTRKIKKKQKDN
ncbi:MAG: secretin N-terminal domain-containing protein [Planctomycetota bacterium]|jgi:type IV pilus assembly protein PilQ